MKLIPLSKTGKHKGKYFAQVDDADYDWLNKFNWSVNKNKWTFYAKRAIYINGKQKLLLMHREILGISNLSWKKVLGDHKDGNGLNNQRNNLRKATYFQNVSNRSKGIKSTSDYLGVYFCKRRNRWLATIGHKYKKKAWVFPPTSQGEIEAAKKHDEMAKKLHGEFAILNFI